MVSHWRSGSLRFVVSAPSLRVHSPARSATDLRFEKGEILLLHSVLRHASKARVGVIVYLASASGVIRI
jgi:hypothetical protein